MIHNAKKNKQNLVEPYSDEDLVITPDMQSKVDELIKFFDDYGINYDNFDPEMLAKIDNKKAYPNYDQYQNVPGQHDTQKWLDAVKTVYYKERNGSIRSNAIRQVTSGWNLMETHDFLNWLKFYEEGAHLKYKVAQNWYENGTPGYFLHIKQDAPKQAPPPISGRDIDNARDDAADEMTTAEKKHIIEKQRQKIIGRLDSAEKLLRTPEGQLFAGKELESLMETIYSLKKKIQLVNKISSSTRLYEDMIIREANVLSRKGFVKGSSLLYSVAEDKPLSPPPPAPPGLPSGAPGGLPSMGPGMPQNPPESAPNDAPPAGIAKFLDNLDTGNLTTKEDKHDAEDELEVEDSVLEVQEADDTLLVTEAQEIPDAPPAPKVPAPAEPPATEEPLEVKENELVDKPDANKPSATARDFDNMIDAAFANLSVNDVVSKLEDLSKIFKTREIPRQLAIVDMMLDSLGLAAFFPSLSEATNKALESNNYISIRVDEILSKLRGTMATKDIDLKGTNNPDRPEIAGLKNKLKEDVDKEKARKDMRKQQQNAELDATQKESPNVEIDEDLGGETPPVAAATPPAPPKAPPKAPPPPPPPPAV